LRVTGPRIFASPNCGASVAKVSAFPPANGSPMRQAASVAMTRPRNWSASRKDFSRFILRGGHWPSRRAAKEIVAAVAALLINLLAIALYHDKQAEVLNSTAAALCAFIAVLHLWRRWRSR